MSATCGLFVCETHFISVPNPTTQQGATRFSEALSDLTILPWPPTIAELLRPKTLPFIVVVGENLKDTVSDSVMGVTGPGDQRGKERDSGLDFSQYKGLL